MFIQTRGSWSCGHAGELWEAENAGWGLQIWCLFTDLSPLLTTCSMRSEPRLHNFSLRSRGLPWASHAGTQDLLEEWVLTVPLFGWEGLCCALRGELLLAPCLLRPFLLHQLHSLSLLKAEFLKWEGVQKVLERSESVCWCVEYLVHLFDASLLSGEFQKSLCVCVNHSFSWVICLCLIDLWELFTSSRHSLLCNKCNCKYVSPLCSWHFHSPNGLFCELNLSILMWSNLSSITIFNCFNLKIFFHTVGAMKRPPSMKCELWNRTGVKGLANILCATGERLWSRRLSSVLPCV